MGDRAMAEIKVSEGSLYFYTHWHGHELPAHAREALQVAQPRIGDDAYALRIILDKLISLNGSRDQLTGCGIMLKPSCEDEYNHDKPSVLIDLVANRVEVYREQEAPHDGR